MPDGSIHDDLDLFALPDTIAIEELARADALAGCFFCGTSVSTASCPGSTAATVGCASTIS